MISPDLFRKLALSFNNVEEKPHFNKTSFRINGKIFATLDSQKKTVSLKLSLVDQSIYCVIKPSMASPATGAWGKQGWTVLYIEKISKTILTEASKKAFNMAAQKEKKLIMKTGEQIQTLHPDKNKTNKKISLDKYNTIKGQLLIILKNAELTHTELMEQLYQNVKDKFDGGVQWYGETVKLDLEARKIVERTGTKPDRYRLRTTKP